MRELTINILHFHMPSLTPISQRIFLIKVGERSLPEKKFIRIDGGFRMALGEGHLIYDVVNQKT
jgi:hypothetical protein